MNRAWPTIETEPPPIPKLEGKYVWGRAYLKHHAIGTGTVQRSGRNQKVIVLLRGNAVCIFLDRKFKVRFLCSAQIEFHFGRVYTGLQTQIHSRIGTSIQEVVAFVLGVVH